MSSNEAYTTSNVKARGVSLGDLRGSRCSDVVGVKTQPTRFQGKMAVGERERRWCEEAIVLQRGSATGKGMQHQGRVRFCFNMGGYFSIYECDDAEESAAMLGQVLK